MDNEGDTGKGSVDNVECQIAEEYFKTYNDSVMISKHQKVKSDFNSYIESIRGLVQASELEMHASFLRTFNDIQFCNIMEKLKETCTQNHFKVRTAFLNYIAALRKEEIVNDDFEIHVSRLREYKNLKVDKGDKYKYYVFFNKLKELTWRIIPFFAQFTAGKYKITKKSYIEYLYYMLHSIDYDKATLYDVLKPLGLLHLVNDVNIELMSMFKILLRNYHPDKNENEKCTDIFTIINGDVYKPVCIIFDDFEKYTNNSYVYCQLDEFLTWTVKEIKEIRDVKDNSQMNIQEKEMKVLAVYNHFLHKHEPKGDFGYSVLDERFKWQRPAGTFTMTHYRNEKAYILDKKDEILLQIRELLSIYIVRAMINVKKETNLSLKMQMENQADTFTCQIKEKKIIYKEMINEMIKLIYYFLPLYEPMLEKYQKEINYLKELCAGKINFEDKWKVRADWNKDEQKKCLQKIKISKLNIFVDERRLNLYQERVKILQDENKEMKCLLNFLNCEIKEMQSNHVRNIVIRNIDKAKHIFSNFSNKQSAKSELITIINEYKCIRDLCRTIKSDSQWVKLVDINLEFKKKYKTEKEKREKVTSNKLLEKAEIKSLVNERKKLEMKTYEERNAKETAEHNCKIYEEILLKYKKGEISIEQIKNINIGH